MTASEIRKQFLQFFKDRAHTIVPSASVIPYDDPTLLFTNAGMNQFKDVFLGTGKRDYVRAADSQKCIRVSGKHNDLEEVGRDTYHHTFFEMLGNWSFGDYYKKEAIEWAWELLTDVWKMDKRRLYATVFETDDESFELWKKVTDITHSHIRPFGKKDNFWEMGETGPCGPCSEIHIDLTPDLSGGKLVNAGDPRVMEIWNLVFIQYNRDEKGTMTPLPAKHVDTGMGFERLCAVLQGKKSNYDTDVFMPIIDSVSNITKKVYSGSVESPTDTAMRVVADHVRMLTFSIADGGIPSNEGRGYVMRRILRRAARFGRTLEMHEPFLYKVVDAVVQSMGEQYPEIREKQSLVERIIKGEEEGFNTTLDRGLEIFESVVQKISDSKTFPGEDAFKLSDTYGFPLDLTELMAKELGLKVDSGRFEELMEEQRERSRVTRYAEISGKARIINDKESVKAFDTSQVEKDSQFIGYEENECKAEIIQSNDNLIVLNRTPFYAESGGQVGDQGEIEVDGIKLRVTDTQKSGNVNVHILEKFYEGTRRAAVTVRVDKIRRLKIMRNHTATHLFHEALRRVVGTHAHQQGSLVAPNHLRFDFNHFEKITPDQIRRIEDIVNEKIADDILIEAENNPEKWIPIEEAKKRYPNVKMFFGDKYGDKVRIVVIDPKFSVELCGGTHVKDTREIGLFKIISESSIASGIRRIEAVTGDGLRRYIGERLEKVGKLDEQISKMIEEKESLEKQLGQHKQGEPLQHRSFPGVSSSSSVTRADIDAVDSAVQQREQKMEEVAKTLQDVQKELSKHRVKEASSGIDAIISQSIAVDGFKVVSARIEVANADELKSLGDALRDKLQSGVGVLGAVIDEKVSLVCVVTDDLIKSKQLQAGKIVGELAKRVGGGGGGRPHLATAGGKDVAKLDQTLKDAPSIIHNFLK
jgi:alanyl-tRNA synthetase